MNTTDEIERLIQGVQFDNQSEWLTSPGAWCIETLQRIGTRGVAVVYALLAKSADNRVSSNPDVNVTIAALNAVTLLVAVNMPQADNALADALKLSIEDEVRDQITEVVTASKRLRASPLFESIN